MKDSLEKVYEDMLLAMFQDGNEDTSLQNMIAQFELEIEYLTDLYEAEELGSFDTFKKLAAARLELARLISILPK